MGIIKKFRITTFKKEVHKIKLKKISLFLIDFNNIEYLLDYFEKFNENLSKKTLNSFLKSVSNP